MPWLGELVREEAEIRNQIRDLRAAIESELFRDRLPLWNRQPENINEDNPASVFLRIM